MERQYLIVMKGKNGEQIEELMEAGMEEIRQRAKYEGWWGDLDWTIYQVSENERCLYCGSNKTYIIDNRDPVNRENLADDEDPDALFMGCDNCGHYEEIDREETTV